CQKEERDGRRRPRRRKARLALSRASRSSLRQGGSTMQANKVEQPLGCTECGHVQTSSNGRPPLRCENCGKIGSFYIWKPNIVDRSVPVTPVSVRSHGQSRALGLAIAEMSQGQADVARALSTPTGQKLKATMLAYVCENLKTGPPANSVVGEMG